MSHELITKCARDRDLVWPEIRLCESPRHKRQKFKDVSQRNLKGLLALDALAFPGPLMAGAGDTAWEEQQRHSSHAGFVNALWNELSLSLFLSFVCISLIFSVFLCTNCYLHFFLHHLAVLFSLYSYLDQHNIISDISFWCLFTTPSTKIQLFDVPVISTSQFKHKIVCIITHHTYSKLFLLCKNGILLTTANYCVSPWFFFFSFYSFYSFFLQPSLANSVWTISTIMDEVVHISVECKKKNIDFRNILDT